MSLKFKDIKNEDRPRERLIKYGKENLSNIELLSIILRTGTYDMNVFDLSSVILTDISAFRELKDINIHTLIKHKGIGVAKSCVILAAIELGRRLYLMNETNSKIILNNSGAIYKNNKYLFFDKQQEYFYCIYLNNKKEMIERRLLFMGTVNKSLVHPREIFKEAYLLSASGIICMHNHPSGDVVPSMEDIALTNALVDIGRIQQIPVLDHLIFGNDKYYSFFDEGFIK